MRTIAAAVLLASTLFGQLVLPPAAATEEGNASDGDVLTYMTFRAANRYPASWLGNPRTITQVAWRADATYAWTYDRLPGYATVRVGQWSGQQSTTWSTTLTLAFQGVIDPPQMSVAQAWTPQPFTFAIPLTTPVPIVQAGLEVDIAFVGPWDPVWGTRATYWVDSAQGQQPTLSDLWLAPPPYLGCGGWISETRTDRIQGQLTMEARETNLPSAPAILVIGSNVQLLGCAHVAGTVFIPAVTDTGGWLQIHMAQPTSDLLFTWQLWIYNAALPADQCFGSGHACGWRINSPWPCQLVYAYDATAAQPSYSLPGIAWVIEVR